MNYVYYNITYFDKDGNRLRAGTAKVRDIYKLNEDFYYMIANQKFIWHHCKIYLDGDLVAELNNRNIVS